MHDEGVFVGVAVVVGAAAGLRESESDVEGDRGGAGGADFEEDFGRSLEAAPVYDCGAEGAADAGTAGGGGDGYAFEFGGEGGFSGVGRRDDSYSEACEGLILESHKETAVWDGIVRRFEDSGVGGGRPVGGVLGSSLKGDDCYEIRRCGGADLELRVAHQDEVPGGVGARADGVGLAKISASVRRR